MNTVTVTQEESAEKTSSRLNRHGSRLPMDFVKRGATVASYRKVKRRGLNRLPFVAKQSSKTIARYWDLPASGGYFGGYETGEAMAQALLKIMRNKETSGFNIELTNIVESFMVRFEQEGGSSMANKNQMADWSESFDSFRGQYVGFFNTLCQWLELSAIHIGRNLDSITEKEISGRASMGLSFDYSGYMDSLSDC